MSFKSDLESKTKDILGDIAAKKRLHAETPKQNLEEKDFSTAPGRTGDLQDRKWLTNKVAELTAAIEAVKEDTKYLELPLDQLHEAPGRRRKLSVEEYTELRENLRSNDLVTPITVRKRSAGGYEIISGHNRVAVYREIGNSMILAVIQETSEAQADINAFYANLLQTNLTDYEKFIGFKMIQERSPKMKQSDIAEQSGKSESFISRLMAFQDLPESSLSIIDACPSILGMDAAYKLAAIAKAGKAEKVSAAIEKLAAHEIDQKQAIKMASQSDTQKAAAVKAKPITIKSGKSNYCAMHRVNKVLRIEFKLPEEAEAIEDAVREVLQKRAEQLKTTEE